MTDLTLRDKLLIALAKPIASDRQLLAVRHFDPWHDILQGIHGSYASESDDLMIGALEAIRDRGTFEFIEQHGFIAEFMLYVLSGHGLTDYGTSPRGGWPDHSIEDLWQPMIDKWKAYSDRQWSTIP